MKVTPKMLHDINVSDNTVRIGRHEVQLFVVRKGIIKITDRGTKGCEITFPKGTIR